jgi:hypothetical protein
VSLCLRVRASSHQQTLVRFYPPFPTKHLLVATYVDVVLSCGCLVWSCGCLFLRLHRLLVVLSCCFVFSYPGLARFDLWLSRGRVLMSCRAMSCLNPNPNSNPIANPYPKLFFALAPHPHPPCLFVPLQLASAGPV